MLLLDHGRGAVRSPAVAAAHRPFQSVHGPYEAPDRFVSLYADPGSPHYIADESRRVHQGMVTALDEAIGNITSSMKAHGMWNNTLIWFTSGAIGSLLAGHRLHVPPWSRDGI